MKRNMHHLVKNTVPVSTEALALNRIPKAFQPEPGH